MVEATDEFCPLCPSRERIPRRPPVCDADRAWLPNAVADLAGLVRQLAERDHTGGDYRIAPYREPQQYDEDNRPLPRVAARDDAGNLLVRNRDPVAAVIPTGANIRGTRPLPVDVDAIDVLLRVRPGSRALFTRGALGLDPDQIGHLSLATALDSRVREWRKLRNAGESLPPARIGRMLRWLYDRVEWACDEYADVADFAAEVREYRSTFRRLLGLVNVPEYKTGVPCPKCWNYTLYQSHGGARDGSLWIECGECPSILSPDEYTAWTRELTAKHRKTRKLSKATICQEDR